MPGLPKVPAALGISVDDKWEIKGYIKRLERVFGMKDFRVDHLKILWCKIIMEDVSFINEGEHVGLIGQMGPVRVHYYLFLQELILLNQVTSQRLNDYELDTYHYNQN